jgi:hypothetical protein
MSAQTVLRLLAGKLVLATYNHQPSAVTHAPIVVLA